MACNKGITTHAKLEKLFSKETYSISKDSLLIIYKYEQAFVNVCLGSQNEKKNNNHDWDNYFIKWVSQGLLCIHGSVEMSP
jgi:hypothetical protein